MLITWNKTNPIPLCGPGNYLPDTEYVIHKYSSGRLFGETKDRSRFIVYKTGHAMYDHPTVKPVPVVSKLIRIGTQPKDLIIDPFMGSGTTLAAAKMYDRQAIGIEIDEKFCKVAADRLRQNVYRSLL